MTNKHLIEGLKLQVRGGRTVQRHWCEDETGSWEGSLGASSPSWVLQPCSGVQSHEGV